MSLKMRASLNKNKYISGETLKCQIEMDNSSQNENNKISFLTIQLIGRISPRKKYKPQFEEWINARKLEENQSNRIFLKNSTSLKLTQPEDAWFIIYESNPVIIATDIEMKGNLTFQQEIQIPWELPTSFQGNFAQITYFVKISIQKQFEQINSLKLPLSIFNYFSLFERIKIPNILQTFYPSNSSSLTKIESKKMEQKKSIYFNSVWNLLEPADFLIDKNGKEVLKIQIPKRKFYLGESVVGFFNFYQTENFLCQEVAITLETEETLQLFGKSESKSLQNLSIRKVYSEYLENVESIKKTQFCLNIPREGFCQFQTEIISLNWFLFIDIFFKKIEENQTNESNFSSKKEKTTFKIPLFIEFDQN